MKTSSLFIWGIIYFCNMIGFFRILEKRLSELICTRLYVIFKKVTLNIGRVEMINAIVDATTNRQDVIATSWKNDILWEKAMICNQYPTINLTTSNLLEKKNPPEKPTFSLLYRIGYLNVSRSQDFFSWSLKSIISSELDVSTVQSWFSDTLGLNKNCH